VKSYNLSNRFSYPKAQLREEMEGSVTSRQLSIFILASAMIFDVYICGSGAQQQVCMHHDNLI